MDPMYEKRLQRNIIKYSWFKIFTKRVYLPLIAIQLYNNGGVTVEQLAIIASSSALLSVLLELPTGYMADRLGNKFAMVMGSSIMSLSPLFYIFMPNFTGGLIAALLFFGGYSCQSGAIEAFMHDTLVALGRDHEYAKVMGRAQSYGLMGNVVLLIAIPATYAVSHTLPFWLGFVSLSALVVLALNFTYPTRHQAEVQPRNPLHAMRKVVTVHNLPLFLFAGLMLGTSYSSGNYRELVWQHAGVAVSIFGTLLAVSSLIGAVLGRYLHVLDRIKPNAFYMYDLLFYAAFLVLAGITSNPIVVIFAFVMLLGYDRVHGIVFQAKLLQNLEHAYKATLVSALNVFSTIFQALAGLLLGWLVGLQGYGTGHTLFGLSLLAAGLVLWMVLTANKRRLAVPSAASRQLQKRPTPS